MTDLQIKIESLLFYKNEPLSFEWISKTLAIDVPECLLALKEMKSFYEGRGISLVINYEEETVALTTAPTTSTLIQELGRKNEEKELSKQALETLAIIAYKGKITKAEIDYIRGVNSLFILRNLLMRGLVTKKENILDKRAPLYVITHELLSFMGIEEREHLPEYQSIITKLNELEDDFNKENSQKEIIEVGNA